MGEKRRLKGGATLVFDSSGLFKFLPKKLTICIYLVDCRRAPRVAKCDPLS